MLFTNGLYLKESLCGLSLISVILKGIKLTNVKGVPVLLIQSVIMCV